jgi:hypothetical protein
MSYAYKLANETLNELVNMTLIDPETFVKHLNTPPGNAILDLEDCDTIWELKNAVFFKYQGCVYVLDLDRWILYETRFMLRMKIPEEGIKGVTILLINRALKGAP